MESTLTIVFIHIQNLLVGEVVVVLVVQFLKGLARWGS
jgi:hypothetical protein